jgi:hypothetical protein
MNLVIFYFSFPLTFGKWNFFNVFILFFILAIYLSPGQCLDFLYKHPIYLFKWRIGPQHDPSILPCKGTKMRWKRPCENHYVVVGNGDAPCPLGLFPPRLIELPLGSQTVPQVPNVFPQHVPNSNSLYPISFALSSTLVAMYNPPKNRLEYINDQSVQNFWLIFLVMGPINDTHHKKK